jgi:DNA gyrase inhibitor GyrI
MISVFHFYESYCVTIFLNNDRITPPACDSYVICVTIKYLMKDKASVHNMKACQGPEV